MFLLFTCVHFWVWGILRRWAACRPIVFEVIHSCWNFDKYCLRPCGNWSAKLKYFIVVIICKWSHVFHRTTIVPSSILKLYELDYTFFYSIHHLLILWILVASNSCCILLIFCVSYLHSYSEFIFLFFS
jgi:hypothetical protein